MHLYYILYAHLIDTQCKQSILNASSTQILIHKTLKQKFQLFIWLLQCSVTLLLLLSLFRVVRGTCNQATKLVSWHRQQTQTHKFTNTRKHTHISFVMKGASTKNGSTENCGWNGKRLHQQKLRWHISHRDNITSVMVCIYSRHPQIGTLTNSNLQQQ